MTPQAIKLGQLRFAELPRYLAYDYQQISLAFIALAHSYWVVIVRLLWSLTVISCSRTVLKS
jgi:hypothetical protein